MSNKFTGETVRELCLIIAPKSSGAKNEIDTGIRGAAEKTGISERILYHVIDEAHSLAYENAETLIQIAFRDNPSKQNEYRLMEGYPAKPASLLLTEIAAEMGLQDIPPLKAFFDAALRLKNKGPIDIEGVTREILNGRSECDVVQANSLLQEIDFENGLDRAFVEQANQEILLYQKRITDLGRAMFALMKYPDVRQSRDEGIRSTKITQLEIAQEVKKEDGSAIARTTVNTIINTENYCPSLPLVQQIIAFFERELRPIVEKDGLLTKASGKWDEAYFYDLAQQVTSKYPRCAKPNKPKPDERVVEWGKCLDALMKALKIREDDIAEKTNKTKAAINDYRNAEVTRGPTDAKDPVQRACGCKNDQEFLEYGAVAQRIAALHKKVQDEQIVLKFRQSLGITQRQFEDRFNVDYTSLAHLEPGKRSLGDPEKFAEKIGFAHDINTRKFEATARTLTSNSEEESYAIGAVFKGLQKERLPAEFYFYKQMGLEPNPEDFRRIQELRDRIRPLYPHLQKTSAAESGDDMGEMSGAGKRKTKKTEL